MLHNELAVVITRQNTGRMKTLENRPRRDVEQQLTLGIFAYHARKWLSNAQKCKLENMKKQRVFRLVTQISYQRIVLLCDYP